MGKNVGIKSQATEWYATACLLVLVAPEGFWSYPQHARDRRAGAPRRLGFLTITTGHRRSMWIVDCGGRACQ